MKKLLAILLVLTAFPVRSMETEKQIIGGLLASFCVYTAYQFFKPDTLEDFKREQENRDIMRKAQIEAGKSFSDREDYKRRCLEAGRILEK